MSLELDNIHRRFGAAPAVAGASLTVHPGEIVCLFGPSGCGKTTLLRAVAGLEPIEDGQVRLDGRALAGPGFSLAPEARPIGFVFQDYVLFPHLTALENVAFGLRDLPPDMRRAKAGAELGAMDLHGLGARFPHELSGGQQQRVALARAFVRQPRAMLLDEPFASIDVVLRRRLRDDLRKLLRARGSATILVTHDPEEALALGDRIAVMRAGRIIELATPEVLHRSPATIDGAMIFPGACRIDAATLATIGIDAPGMVREAVLFADAAWAEPDPRGAFTVEDCRFVGPGWRLSVRAGAGAIDCSSAACIATGATVRVRADPSAVRFFAGA